MGVIHAFGIGACRRLLVIALLAALAVGIAPRPSAAAPGVAEYDLGMGKNGLGDLAVGPDGTVWFDENYTNQIGRLAPDGTVTRFTPPTQRETAIVDALVAAADGGVWFTEYAARRIGHIAPSGAIAEYPFDTGPGFLPTPAAGPDGGVWFAEPGPKRIGHITPDGVISHFAADPVPYFLTAGPDGNMWFTVREDGPAVGDKLGRVTPSGAVSYVALTTPVTGPIVSGPDGTFRTYLAGRLCGTSYCPALARETVNGQVDPVGSVALRAYPGSIAVGADGDVWLGFAANRVARVAPGGQIAEYAPADAAFAIPKIAAAPDGGIWLTERHTREEWGRIGRLDPSTATPLPDAPDFLAPTSPAPMPAPIAAPAPTVAPPVTPPRTGTGGGSRYLRRLGDG